MSSVMYLEIANVAFRVSSTPYGVKPNLNEPYTPFIKHGPSPRGGHSIDIELVTHESPELEPATCIFDSGPWAMYRTPDGYALCHKPPAFPEPLCTIKADADFTEATAFCSRELLDTLGDEPALLNPIRYPLDQVLLMHKLASGAGVIVHAAGITVGERGYIFPGRSGAGKSTLTRQLEPVVSFDLMSDDRIVVRKTAEGLRMFGTPWPGEAGIARAEDAALSGIIFITHGRDNAIVPLEPKHALERLLTVCSIPWYDKEVLPPALGFVHDLVESVPSYLFDFTPTAEAAEAIGGFISA